MHGQIKKPDRPLTRLSQGDIWTRKSGQSHKMSFLAGLFFRGYFGFRWQDLWGQISTMLLRRADETREFRAVTAPVKFLQTERRDRTSKLLALPFRLRTSNQSIWCVQLNVEEVALQLP